MLSKEENNNHGEGVNCKSQNIMRKSQEETLREMPEKHTVLGGYFPLSRTNNYIFLYYIRNL